MQFGLEGGIHFIQYISVNIATPKWEKKRWTPLKYVESIIYTIPKTLFYLFGGSYPVEVVLPEVHASYLVNRKVIQLEYSKSP